jgi:predicted permease
MKDAVAGIGYSVRTLLRTPVAVGAMVLSLGLAIGGVTAAFSFGNAFLLRGDPAVTDPASVAMVWVSGGSGGRYGVGSYPDFEAVAAGVPAFESVALSGMDVRHLGDRFEGPPLMVEVVTPAFFDVLGVRPRLGRVFLPEEAVVGRAERLLVLSHSSWKTHFFGDPGVLGREVELSGHPFTVVGVAPEGLRGRMLSLDVDGWIPIGIPNASGRRKAEALRERGDRDFMIHARLREGATVAEAEAQLERLSAALMEAYPEEWADERGEARAFTLTTGRNASLNPDARRSAMAAVGFLLVAALLILAIACANVAGLQLARAQRRTREMAIRSSLGAGRGRLLMLLLGESLIVGLGGGALGVFLAYRLVARLDTLTLPIDLPLRFDFTPDGTVLTVAVLVSVGTSVLFGLVPALEGSRPDVMSVLKGSGAGGRTGRSRFRRFLVVAQVAVSVLLLVGAGLLLRSVQGADSSRLGFQPEGLAVMSKTLDEQYRSADGYVAYVAELDAALRSRPGVREVHFSRGLEAGSVIRPRADLEVPGYEPAPGEAMTLPYNSVTPGYLEVLGIPLLSGRLLRESDRAGGTPVAVVSRSFADRFWPGMDPLGRRFSVSGRRIFGDRAEGSAVELVVVGVAGDVGGFHAGAEKQPFFWTSLYQDSADPLTILLAGDGATEEMVRHLREVVVLTDGEQPLVAPQSFEALLAFDLLVPRMGSRALALGGGFGLLLAVVGLYGLVSFVVSQRAREMAIRLAVGAPWERVGAAVMWDGVRLAALGLVLGLAMAVPLGRYLESEVYGVHALDPLAIGGASVTLLVAALAASVAPAVRAVRQDPMSVLRSD